MSFNSTKPRVEYTANANQSVFTFLFKIYTKTDLVVYLTKAADAPDDVADKLTVDVDYTVLINGDNGGSITLTTPAGLGDRLTLIRSLNRTRDVEYQTNGDLLAETLNADQNYQTYLIADVIEANGRVITLPQNSQATSNNFPPASSNAYIKWNATGTALENDNAVPEAIKAALEAEAKKRTADSYATEPEDVFVKIWTSNGDGTFSYTNSTEYSSLHWAAKSHVGSELNGLTDVEITNEKDRDALVYDSSIGKWVNGESVGFITQNKNVLNKDFSLVQGESGVTTSFTIADGITLTIPDGSILSVV